MPTNQKLSAGQLGVVTGNVVTMRKKPEWSSEQISQVLIGQPVAVEGGQKTWLFVQAWDSYRGWVPSQGVGILRNQSRAYASTGPVAVVRSLFADIFSAASEHSRIITKVTVSAELEYRRSSGDWVETLLPDGRVGYVYKRDVKLVDKDIAQTMWLPDPAKLVETALRFIGVPYLWGGTSTFGLDCSGFVQLIYRIHNVGLPRDSYMQASDSRAVPVESDELRAGDMVFFAKEGGDDIRDITHVGMMISRTEFIHACGALGVTVTSFDDPHYNSIYWGGRRLRLCTMDPGGGMP